MRLGHGPGGGGPDRCWVVAVVVVLALLWAAAYLVLR